MIYGNALRDLFMRMGRNPWQQYQMPVEPPQFQGGPFAGGFQPGLQQPMPFEGNWQNPLFNAGKGVPNMGTNVPNMRNALMGLGGNRSSGMRQRY